MSEPPQVSNIGMEVEVHFFSRLRDVVGFSSMRMTLPNGASITDLLARLYVDHPGLQRWDPHLLLAVGLDYVDRTQPLCAGDVVSIMPPVQGG